MGYLDLKKELVLAPQSENKVRLKTRLALAPMAGITHAGFRFIIKRIGGCGIFFSELIPSLSVLNQGLKHFSLYNHYEVNPFFYQLLVNRTDGLSEAISMLETLNPDGFDLNMGCTAPIVLKKGGGAALLNNPELALMIIRTLRRSTSKPFTIKLRTGKFSKTEFLEFVKSIVGEGIDALIIHPRDIKSRFTGKPCWDYVNFVIPEIDIPVFANGSINTNDDAKKVMETCDPSGLMIGRAAVKNPWIFKEIIEDRISEKHFVNLLKEYINELEKVIPEERRAGRLKEFISYFAKNYAFSHLWETKVQNAKNVSEIEKISYDFMNRNEAYMN